MTGSTCDCVLVNNGRECVCVFAHAPHLTTSDSD